MTPEATILDGVLSGRLPLSIILLSMILWIIFKGGAKLDSLTAAVAAVGPAILAHKADTTAELHVVKAHVTNEVNRVIGVITDRRAEILAESVAGVERAVSDPDLHTPLTRRGSSGTRPVTR